MVDLKMCEQYWIGLYLKIPLLKKRNKEHVYWLSVLLKHLFFKIFFFVLPMFFVTNLVTDKEKSWIQALQTHFFAFRMTPITHIIYTHMPRHIMVYILHIL